jgi:hypothetical protein
MKITTALQHGLSLVSHHRKMVGIIYLVNLCAALLFAFPLFVLFRSQAGSLVIRDELLSGLSYSWWSSFHFSAEGLASSIRPSLSGGFGPLFDSLELLLTGQFLSYGWFIFVIAVAYLFIAAFFNGGAIALFADERKSFSAARFFSGAGAYFHHMAALAATTIIIFAGLYKIINPFIFKIVDSIVADTTSQSFSWIVNLIGYILIFALVFLIMLIFDYAKVIVINDKKTSSWLCIWLSIKFIFGNFFKAFGLNLLLVLFAVALVIVGGTLLSFIKPTQVFLILVVLLIQQIYVMTKIAVRLTFYASETVFYQQQTAAATTVKKRKH